MAARTFEVSHTCGSQDGEGEQTGSGPELRDNQEIFLFLFVNCLFSQLFVLESSERARKGLPLWVVLVEFS